MIYYSTEAGLKNAIQKDISSRLHNKLAPTVKNIIKERLESDIYSYKLKSNGWGEKYNGRWSRGTYKRRRELKKKLISKVDTRSGTLLITSNALPNDSRTKGAPSNWFHSQDNGAFFLLLERDNPGLWAGGFKRPIIQNAQEEVKTSKRVAQAIQNIVDSMNS